MRRIKKIGSEFFIYTTGEILAMRLATIHNISFYLRLMKELRDNIK
ncbi:MAG: hypothetical protein ABIH67_02735 [Candidatus Uhrbacteria bacterium]